MYLRFRLHWWMLVDIVLCTASMRPQLWADAMTCLLQLLSVLPILAGSALILRWPSSRYWTLSVWTFSWGLVGAVYMFVVNVVLTTQLCYLYWNILCIIHQSSYKTVKEMWSTEIFSCQTQEEESHRFIHRFCRRTRGWYSPCFFAIQD